MKTKLTQHTPASEKASVALYEDNNENELLRQELVSYFKTEEGLVKETIIRVFSEDNTYYESRVSTPIVERLQS
jgi:hypothetical protein